jgi:hypothetical protein
MVITDTRVIERTTAGLTQALPYVIHQGGTSCFVGSQMVFTNCQSKAIKDLKIGDFVNTYNEQTKQNEFKKVLNVFKYDNHKPTLKIKLKNGKTITVTDDHKFYYQGSWVAIKDILNGNMESNTKL